MLVEIYRNLNRKGLWFSIRDRKTGLVTKRIDLKAGDTYALENPSFVVSAAGRARVLREKRKNVHATIRGVPIDEFVINGLVEWRVKYDPYNNSTFIGVNSAGNTIPLKKARYVTFDGGGVTAWIKP